jgi:S-formylglutathione hydrolase FrmB
MRDWSLLDGIVPGVDVIIGSLALVYLLARNGRRWWLAKVPIALVIGAGLVLMAAYLMNNVFRLFPDALPPEILFWIGLGIFSVLLAVLPFPGSGWWSRIGRVVAALVVLVAAGAQVNVYYGRYSTVGALLGSKPELTDFAKVLGTRARTVPLPPGKTLEEVWTPPSDMPARGMVSEVPIPGTASAFKARNAVIYLPPAYAADPRPLLPVLVLLPGQPGGPEDWFIAGEAAKAMDTFASQHHGLAPVVVVADPSGSTFASTLCLDTGRGNAETYLAMDVPAWIEANLQVDTDHKMWGVGGYSHGGTCALQLAIRAPEVYPSFIDISGPKEPTLSSRRTTANEAFGGDASASTQVNPLDILATTSLPEVGGYLAVGDHDVEFRPQQQRVLAACRRARLQVQYHELPGAHSWAVWRPALVAALPWYAERTRLT